MARYTLTKPSFLGTRYHAEGSVVDWDGPPNKAMVPMDDEAKDRLAAHEARKGARAAKEAREVPQPGGEPPNPTWAPQPRPAFSRIVMRNLAPDHAKDDESSIVREAAGIPSAGAAPSAPGDMKADTDKSDAKPALRATDQKPSQAAPKVTLDRPGDTASDKRK